MGHSALFASDRITRESSYNEEDKYRTVIALNQLRTVV